MRPIKQSKSTLDIEDMKNGGNQKVFDAINADFDQKELKKRVRLLKGLDLKHAQFDYLKKILIPFMNGYFVSSTATNIEEPIYRAVSWSTKPTNAPITQKSQFSMEVQAVTRPS
jgi:hypothetical protein